MESLQRTGSFKIRGATNRLLALTPAERARGVITASSGNFALGVIVAGIPGALIAVPCAAVLNAVVQHLAEETDVGDSAREAAEDDPAPPPAPEPS
jgi:hypothetical protein